VSSQNKCGSCWAQAAIDSFEIALAKKKKLESARSVQQIIDCVKTKNSNGCSGGTPMDALEYLRTHPSASAKEYPYTGVKGKCKHFKHDKKHPKSFGFEKAHFTFADDPDHKKYGRYKVCTKAKTKCYYRQSKYELELVLAVKKDGPYIAYVDAKNWPHYRKGIYPDDKCTSDPEKGGNHVVQLVGFGQRGGIPYWLVKNSWGPKWGENGYILLPFGSNACGIANYVGRAALSAASAKRNKVHEKMRNRVRGDRVAKPPRKERKTRNPSQLQ
jgi:C1A family cysteine protease